MESADPSCETGEEQSRQDHLDSSRQGDWMGTPWRALRRFYAPGSPAPVVILVLGPAVGVSVAVLNLVVALMFPTPPHVAEPERVINVAGISSYDGYLELAASVRSVELAGHAATTMHLESADTGAPVAVQCVTGNYLPVLGVRPVRGRVFSASDAPAEVAVIGHSVWIRRFAGASQAIGKQVTLRRRTYTVIGVAPAGFRGLGASDVDVWIPLDPLRETCSSLGAGMPFSAGYFSMRVVGRVRRGISVGQAEAELNTLHASSSPGTDALRVEPVLASGRRVLRHNGAILAWLVAGAGVALLMACSNAVALFTISAVGRRRELAVRACLGAPPWRLARSLIGESVAAAALCAVAGWGTALAVGITLGRYFPAAPSPTLFDARLWLLTSAVALLACTLTGMAPAWRATRDHAATLLKSDPRVGRGRARLRAAVIVAQVAVAFALIVGSGLFWESITRLRAAVGFDVSGLVAITLDPIRSTSEDDVSLRAHRDAVYRRLQLHLGEPGVALASYAPHDTMPQTYVFLRRSARTRPELAAINAVSVGYFRVMGTSILTGRDFLASDSANGPPVVVLSRELAQRVWHSEKALGTCAFLKGSAECARVVGIVESQRARRIAEPTPEVFIPVAQAERFGMLYEGRVVLARSRRGLGDLASVASVAKTAAPGIPVDAVSVTRLMDPQTRSWRLGATVFGLVGVLTFCLAMIGVYYSLSQLMRQRTREIGVRMALGATRLDAWRLALRSGMLLLAAGWALGTGLAFGLARLVRSLLFGLEGVDPLVLAVATLGLFAVGVLACSVPALRATRVDPVRALQVEG